MPNDLKSFAVRFKDSYSGKGFVAEITKELCIVYFPFAY